MEVGFLRVGKIRGRHRRFVACGIQINHQLKCTTALTCLLNDLCRLIHSASDSRGGCMNNVKGAEALLFECTKVKSILMPSRGLVMN